MPFTLAHPAAVLPLKRLCPIYLSFPALVAGSMAPDVPYFFWQWKVGGYAHTLPGIFLLSVPISYCLIWLFKFLSPTAASILPTRHAQFVNSWFANPPNKTLKRAALVLLSILLGILTHVAWDSFTHKHGWYVNELPVLNSEVFQVGTYHVHLYKMLQHGGTLLGLSVLLLAYALNFKMISFAERYLSAAQPNIHY